MQALYHSLTVFEGVLTYIIRVAKVAKYYLKSSTTPKHACKMEVQTLIYSWVDTFLVWCH
jgi:hypothetical protein